MIHVLRTRSPVYSPLRAFSLDLHVLGTPPAFVLSQDQTLQLCPGWCTYLLHSKHCGVRNLLRGLAIRFSKTELLLPPSDSNHRPRPASQRGALPTAVCISVSRAFVPPWVRPTNSVRP